jgi:hypothetical protein
VRKRLNKTSHEQPGRETVRNHGSISYQCNDQEPAEYGQTFDTVGLRPRKALHKGGKICIVGPQLRPRDGSGNDQTGAQELHQNKQKECPRDENREYGR